MSLFDSTQFGRLRESLTKTRDALFGKLQHIFSSKHKIDEELLDNIEEVLLGADVGVETTNEILRRVRDRVKELGYQQAAELDTLLREEIRSLLVNGNSLSGHSAFPSQLPFVIMVVGVNGVGKTTTIGKLAHRYKSSGKRVLIAAADTFRAAASEQLEIWAQRAGVDIIGSRNTSGAGDPAAVAFDAVKMAMSRQVEVLIIDTAGRLHTKINLMEELKKIKRILRKHSSEAPHEVLLVLDASIGQNAIQQAKQFGEAVGVTGLVITKLDGTAKGGVVLAISRELNIPVKFVGIGENIDDLQPFDRQAFVEALF